MTNNEQLRINHLLLARFRKVLFYTDYLAHLELVDRMKEKVKPNISKTTYPDGDESRKTT